MSGGFRYVLEFRDPVSGWSLRMTADDSAMLLKMWADMDHRVWRVRDRSTDTVISQAST